MFLVLNDSDQQILNKLTKDYNEKNKLSITNQEFIRKLIRQEHAKEIMELKKDNNG